MIGIPVDAFIDEASMIYKYGKKPPAKLNR